MPLLSAKKPFTSASIFAFSVEYMDYMRNELNIVILYDRSAKTYYYSNKGLYDSLKQWIA